MADKQHFEQIYSNSDYEFTYPYNDDVISDILNNRHEGTILDLGCGEGGLSIQLSQFGYDVTAIDVSQSAIANLNKHYSQINGIATDVEEYYFGDFDIIVAEAVLHFLKKENATKILKKIQENTKPGGLNLIVAFTDDSVHFDDNLFYPKSNFFMTQYDNWLILKLEEFQEDENKMVYLLAKKR